MTRYYRTVKEARGALALDTGFDPFAVHMGVRDHAGRLWNTPTKEALAALGYAVDPRRVAEMERGHHCVVCQTPIEKQEWDGMEYFWPTECREHTKWGYTCDNGHRWKMTDAEAKNSDHKCPTCGEYSV